MPIIYHSPDFSATASGATTFDGREECSGCSFMDVARFAPRLFPSCNVCGLLTGDMDRA